MSTGFEKARVCAGQQSTLPFVVIRLTIASFAMFESKVGSWLRSHPVGKPPLGEASDSASVVIFPVVFAAFSSYAIRREEKLKRQWRERNEGKSPAAPD